MVFFVVALPLKEGSEKKSHQAAEQCCNPSGRQIAEVYPMNSVDKSRFKIGTLDSLMELNESLGKLDGTVDAVCKKIERQLKDFKVDEPKIEGMDGSIAVEDYIRNFQWDDSSYSRNRALGDIANQIGSKVKITENDVKKIQDELNEEKLKLQAFGGKKDGSGFYGKDLGEEIYKRPGEAYFQQAKDSKLISTYVVIVHKTKIPVFMDSYEFWPEGSVVPDSAKDLQREDEEGNMLFGVAVLTSACDEFQTKARGAGFTAKKFVYDIEKFQKDQVLRGQIEEKIKLLQKQLTQRCTFTFSNLFITLMHVKIMRVFVDGVLRFGIPPKFFIGIIRPNKGRDNQVKDNLTNMFADPSMKDMYGSKDDVGDGEDFYPYVNVPLTSPIFLN